MGRETRDVWVELWGDDGQVGMPRCRVTCELSPFGGWEPTGSAWWVVPDETVIASRWWAWDAETGGECLAGAWIIPGVVAKPGDTIDVRIRGW